MIESASVLYHGAVLPGHAGPLADQPQRHHVSQRCTLLACWLSIVDSYCIPPFGDSVAFLFTLLLLFESIADGEHFRFQTAKHALTAEQRAAHSDPDVRNGFYTNGKQHWMFIYSRLSDDWSWWHINHTGMFQYCRHPNYFCEQVRSGIFIT